LLLKLILDLSFKFFYEFQLRVSGEKTLKLSCVDSKTKKILFNQKEIDIAILCLIKQNQNIFSYQQVINWSFQEFFYWIYISSEYEAIMNKN